jgi:hypothetical protein
MKLSFQHVSGTRQHDRAISVCAYMSDKFDAEKHLKPFAEFVVEGQEGYDILVFREPGMSVPVGPTTLVYDVTSPGLGYARHLWRYLGGELGYDWTWFRGMDQPAVPQRERQLENATIACKNDVLIWQRLGFSCMGRLGATPRGIRSFLDFLAREEYTPTVASDWNIDERFLSQWINRNNVRTSLAMDGPLASNPWQLEWILHRLIRGHHTTIFKDRDDR